MRKIEVKGTIVGNADKWIYEWFGMDATCPKDVNAAISEANGEPLLVEINSGGGSVFAGFEMYSVLRSAGCRTVAEVQSLAASAASVVMLGCQEVHASPVAQVMIHLPSMGTQGDRYDH
ncbi:MAG TPA: peptidase, partial [Tyzzerella sp.]|nr:peptidase [Tyzzerella sp.]